MGFLARSARHWAVAIFMGSLMDEALQSRAALKRKGEWAWNGETLGEQARMVVSSTWEHARKAVEELALGDGSRKTVRGRRA